MATLQPFYNHVSNPTLFALDGDPTTFDWGGTNGEMGSTLLRTDNNTWYRKDGPDAQDWVAMGAGPGPGNAAWVVVRPGGTAGGNVFLTPAAAYEAVEFLRSVGCGRINIEIDSRFGAVTWPAGTWDFTDVWVVNNPAEPDSQVGAATLLTIADGATFTAANGTVYLWGRNFDIVYNGVGLVTPFEGPNLINDGCRIYPTSALAKPLFKGTGFNLYRQVGSARGSVGRATTCVAPVFDVAGGAIGFFIEAGTVYNDWVTDSVGAGFAGGRMFDDSANGAGGNNATWRSTPMDLAGGVIGSIFAEHRDRYTVDTVLATSQEGTGDSLAVAAGMVTLTDAGAAFSADSEGLPIVISGSGNPANDGQFTVDTVLGPTQLTYANAAAVAEPGWAGDWVLPWNALPNELCNVESTAKGTSILAPYAIDGERFCVFDYEGNATANPATIIPRTGDTVDDPTVDTDDQGKTWRYTKVGGVGRWVLNGS